MQKNPLNKFEHKRLISKFCGSLGVTEFWKIPIRKNGMTSSGNKNQCHWNVRKLVHLYGGKVVLGYEVYKIGDTVNLTNHSVWETPEGNVVDVTVEESRDNKDQIIFLPISKYNTVNNAFKLKYNLQFSKNIHQGVFLYSLEEVQIDGSVNEGFKVYNNYFQRTDFKYDNLIPVMDKVSYFFMGGFSKLSTSSGKSFDTIWNEKFQIKP